MATLINHNSPLIGERTTFEQLMEYAASHFMADKSDHAYSAEWKEAIRIRLNDLSQEFSMTYNPAIFKQSHLERDKLKQDNETLLRQVFFGMTFRGIMDAVKACIADERTKIPIVADWRRAAVRALGKLRDDFTAAFPGEPETFYATTATFDLTKAIQADRTGAMRDCFQGMNATEALSLVCDAGLHPSPAWNNAMVGVLRKLHIVFVKASLPVDITKEFQGPSAAQCGDNKYHDAPVFGEPYTRPAFLQELDAVLKKCPDYLPVGLVLSYIEREVMRRGAESPGDSRQAKQYEVRAMILSQARSLIERMTKLVFGKPA